MNAGKKMNRYKHLQTFENVNADDGAIRSPVVELKVWMLRNDLRAVDVQRALGYKSCGGIINYINGQIANRKVAEYLLEKGCPVEILTALKRERDEARRCRNGFQPEI